MLTADPLVRGKGEFRVPLISKVFLGVVTAHVVLEVSLILLTTLPGSSQARAVPEGQRVYDAVIEGILCFAFWGFAISASLTENVFELLSFEVAATILSVRVAYQMFGLVETDGGTLQLVFLPLNEVDVVQVVATPLFNIAYFVLGYKVFKSFGYFTFHSVGVNRMKVDAFRRYLQFLSLLKLAVMLSLVLMITGLLGRVWSTVLGLCSIIAVLCITPFWAVFGWQAAKHESKVGMLCVLAFSVLEPLYVIYKSIVVSQAPPRPGGPMPLFPSLPQYHFTSGYADALTVLDVGLHAAVLVWGIVVIRNFGKGLKETYTHTTVLGQANADAQVHLFHM